MIKRIKKANALMFTVVILLAVSIIASGITMYFYHASIQANNSNIYSNKHIELENEFNKKYKVVLTQDAETDNEIKTKDFFNNHTSESTAFLEGDYYTTIRYFNESNSFTYEVETAYKNKEYHLIKTIYLVDSKFSVDAKEVYYVRVNS